MAEAIVSVKDEETVRNSMKDEEQWYAYAMQLATSQVLPGVLQAAVKLEVLEIISGAGPGAQLSAYEIAVRLPTQNRVGSAASMLDRMLRLLAAYSVLTCSVQNRGGCEQRFYGLAPVGKYFVRDQEGASLGALLNLQQDEVLVQCRSQMNDSVLEGGLAFKKAHGIDLFKYMSKDPWFNEVFNQAMIEHTNLVIRRILEVYKGFDNLKTLVDVGGGLGNNLQKIVSKYPNIKGLNFDLPHVIKNAPIYAGVEHIAGDMFQSVPKGDAIFMKWILHNWSDDRCIELLKNCYEAIPNDGKVIVVDAILPVIPDSSSSAIGNLQMDVMMLTHCPGGRERTEQEFRDLVNAAGFREMEKKCFVSNFWVMDFYK